jgi:peptidoglycan biosynthesis protein MviN/MurJ (putative lipid II flippase)
VGPGRIVLRGMGYPREELVSSLMTAFLNIALSLIFIQLLGFVGTLIGSAIAATVGHLYFLWRLRMKYKEIYGSLTRSTLPKPLIASLLASIPALVFLDMPVFLQASTNRWHGAGLLLTNLFLFGTIYFLVIWYLKYFDAKDYQVFSGIKHFIFKK